MKTKIRKNNSSQRNNKPILARVAVARADVRSKPLSCVLQRVILLVLSSLARVGVRVLSCCRVTIAYKHPLISIKGMMPMLYKRAAPHNNRAPPALTLFSRSVIV